MSLKKCQRVTLILLITAVCFNCTEPFTAITDTFENGLVIEATITDELKNQEIKISHTYKLEEDSNLSYETNAKVTVIGSDNTVYDFEDSGLGVYTSIQLFQAQENVSYKLEIITARGKKYSSTSELLPPKAQIDSVYAELITTEEGTGIQIFVDSEPSEQNANYFRYNYEETYKIVSKYFYPLDVSLNNWKGIGNNPICSDEPELVGRPLNQEICYSSINTSNDIMVTSLNGLDDSRISRYPVRFIPEENYVIRDRYSILVKQFVQSANANNFYRILGELGGDSSLLLDKQPGFIRGNISSEENQNENVIGFFDVSSMSSKRIFFDYTDFDIKKPDYIYYCEILKYNFAATGPPVSNINEREILFWHFYNGVYKYYGQVECVIEVVNSNCADCTLFASNEKPLFWED